jgi:Carboxylesterase family
VRKDRLDHNCWAFVPCRMIVRDDMPRGGGGACKGKNDLRPLLPGEEEPTGKYAGVDMGELMNIMGGATEDCLFMTIYVPGKALEADAEKLPVVNFIGGDWFSNGGDCFGNPLVKGSGNNIILVCAHFRVRNAPISITFYKVGHDVKDRG